MITNNICPVGRRERSKIFFNCSPLYPCFFQRKYIAQRTAIINATTGVPTNSSTGRIPFNAKIYSESVLNRIKTSGTRIMAITVENFGRFASSSSLTSETADGRPVCILFPITYDHRIPAKIKERIPVGTPTAIIIPRSTPSIFATNTEPADGGINANPVASPAKRGIT